MDVSEMHAISSSTNTETVTICLPEISITSLYKPSASTFEWQDLPAKYKKKHAVVIGDFNSHHTMWGYEKTNDDSELIKSWMKKTWLQLELIHNANLPKSFKSCCFCPICHNQAGHNKVRSSFPTPLQSRPTGLLTVKEWTRHSWSWNPALTTTACPYTLL